MVRASLYWVYPKWRANVIYVCVCACDFFHRTRSVGICGYLNGSMLDYANLVGLC
jgi:hypothetical protein